MGEVRVRVRLLGPVRLEIAGRTVRLGSQLRLMLAVLALARGRVVSRSRLIKLLWGEPAPAAAATTLRSHLAHLRRVLEPDRLPAQQWRLVVTEADGYALRLSQDGLDAAQFEQLLAQGRQALRAGDAGTAADRLAGALALWHGPALADVSDRSFAVAEAARLEALRTAARRLRAEAELAIGRHEDALAELTELIATDPADEQLRGQLALALYRCHQLEAAAEACAEGLRLAHERGLDAPALQALQTDILRRAPELDWVAPPRPFQLPPDIADFIGRAAELADIEDRLFAAPGTAVVAIDGKPGVGKSALAVHLSHRLAARFLDGALYVNLRGAEPQQLAPLDVLGQFLRALGVPDQQVPASLDAAAAAFRSALTGRRVLVVLDNAADAAQVRPLLPAAAGCAALITSRRPLVDVDVACSVTLDLLSTDDAVRLLARLAGSERVAADPGSARAVVRYCGLLPLAVRIAGARLRARPGWSIAALAGRLADEQRRLAELAVGDLAVQSSFQLSYQALDPADARLFRLLGLLHCADFPTEVAAALAGQPPAEAEPVLERLVDAQLLETPAPGRYRFHDLLRLFAVRCAEAAEDEPVRLNAVARALEWYLSIAAQARHQLRAGHDRTRAAMPNQRFADAHTALAWLDAERPNLVAAIVQAAAAPAPVCSLAWRLDRELVRYFAIRACWSEWTTTSSAVIAAAGKAGELYPKGAAHRHLGAMCNMQRRLDEALQHLTCALAIFKECGDHHLVAKTLCDIGILYGRRAQWPEATAHFTKVLAAARDIGDRLLESQALNNLGLVLSEQGNLDAAVPYAQQALDVLRDIGERIELSQPLDTLGGIYHKQGRYDDAMACYRECLATARTYGDAYNEAIALRGIGLATAALRSAAVARRYLQHALTIFVSLGAPEAEDVELLLTKPWPAGATAQPPGGRM